jgi:DNA-binding IclR family transcriptional regulator
MDAIAPAMTAASTTQSLDRAIVLLEIVASHALQGITLGDAAMQAGLPKPTAHRLLTGLKNAELIDYSAHARLFYPAFRLFQLGQLTGRRFGVVHLVRPVLRQLALATHDTVYLTLRTGDSLLCIAREQGEFPIKILTLAEGDVRPLGLGSNGIAWLAAQSDQECERLLQTNRKTLTAFPAFSEDKLRRYIVSARRDGYAFSRGFMMPEMSAIAMCINGSDGKVIATVSVAALTSRFDGDRFDFVQAELGRHVKMIETLLNESGAQYELSSMSGIN